MKYLIGYLKVNLIPQLLIEEEHHFANCHVLSVALEDGMERLISPSV